MIKTLNIDVAKDVTIAVRKESFSTQSKKSEKNTSVSSFEDAVKKAKCEKEEAKAERKNENAKDTKGEKEVSSAQPVKKEKKSKTKADKNTGKLEMSALLAIEGKGEKKAKEAENKEFVEEVSKVALKKNESVKDEEAIKENLLKSEIEGNLVTKEAKIEGAVNGVAKKERKNKTQEAARVKLSKNLKVKNELTKEAKEEKKDGKEIQSALKISVEDLRSDIAYKKEEEKGSEKNEKVTFSSDTNKGEFSYTAADLSVDVAKEIKERNAEAFRSKLESLLKNERGEIDKSVKSAKITLFNNDKGEILLVLHPESLGNVKINLKLNENTIETYVSVSTKEAYKAFVESDYFNLKQALSDGGFEVGKFNVAMDAGAAGSGFSQKGEDSPELYNAKRYEEGKVAREEAENYGEKRFSANNYINIVA